MKKLSINFLTRKRLFVIAVIMLLITAGVFLCIVFMQRAERNSAPKQKAAWEQLSPDEQKIAGIYAQLYDVPEEKVAKLKLDMKDWNSVNSRLDTEYFTISETEKYQMSEQGYSLEDLYEAETLARKTGKKASVLAKEKGKAAEGKKWSEILPDNRKDSLEEKLGLTKAQIKILKRKNDKRDERIDIALLCFNRQEAFESIMKKIESGRSIKVLKEETAYEK